MERLLFCFKSAFWLTSKNNSHNCRTVTCMEVCPTSVNANNRNVETKMIRRHIFGKRISSSRNQT